MGWIYDSFDYLLLFTNFRIPSINTITKYSFLFKLFFFLWKCGDMCIPNDWILSIIPKKGWPYGPNMLNLCLSFSVVVAMNRDKRYSFMKSIYLEDNQRPFDYLLHLLNKKSKKKSMLEGMRAFFLVPAV